MSSPTINFTGGGWFAKIQLNKISSTTSLANPFGRNKMKTPFKLLCLCLTLSGVTSAVTTYAELLTFDDLSTVSLGDPTFGIIPQDYGGLNWNNFGVLDGVTVDPSYGYHTGVVSPDNVAFNLSGNQASISVAAGTFDLDSAYLASALNSVPVQQIQVQGYVGSTLVYNNTYTGPTLVNFDYLGIQSVTFTSGSQQFAMDNLTVAVPEPATMGFWTLCSVGAVLLAFKKGKHSSMSS